AACMNYWKNFTNKQENITMNEFESRIDVGQAEEAIKKIQENLNTRIHGQSAMLNQMLVALLAGGHILIEGVPGVAKTLAAKALAMSLNASFSRIQFTPDLMPSDVLGTTIFNQKKAEFEL